MVLILLRLIEVPDGGLASACVLAPVVFAVLKKAVKHGFVLPLIIRPAKHQGVFYPNAAAGKVEPRIHKGFSEVQTLGIRMKNVCGTAFFQVGSHVLKCGQQELIEFFALDGVILNGKSIRGFERNAVGRVRQHKIGFLSVHERGNIPGACGITAHEPVSADRPYIPALHKGSLFQHIVQIEIIILHIGIIVPGEEICDLIILEAHKTHIKVHALQSLDFNLQQRFIPACIHCHTVVGKNVGFLLCLGEIIHEHTRHFLDAFFLGGHHTAMSGDDAVVLIDDDGIDETELPERRAELHNLFRGVGAGVIDIWYKF